MRNRLVLRLDHLMYSAIARLLPRRGDLLYSGCVRVKRLAFTFDDGPSPANTAQIAQLLARHGARATFFLSGSEIPGREQILRGLVEQGHELGNHTFSHALPHELSLTELRGDIKHTDELVVEATDGRPWLVRPPYGKDLRRTVRLGRELSFKTVLWSVDSGDTRGWTDTAIVEHVTKRARPGSIVLMHDGGDLRPSTIRALERLVPELQARGYELVTVSELLTS